MNWTVRRLLTWLFTRSLSWTLENMHVPANPGESVIVYPLA